MGSWTELKWVNVGRSEGYGVEATPQLFNILVEKPRSPRGILSTYYPSLKFSLLMKRWTPVYPTGREVTLLLGSEKEAESCQTGEGTLRVAEVL